MKITDIIKSKSAVLSFEVFPPKTDDKFESVAEAVDKIAALKPDFMSVTYGAGGGTSEYTVKISRHIKQLGVNSVAHLSCISSTRRDVQDKLLQLKEAGIENILALRGDIPKDFEGNLEYSYASELVAEIKKFGGFCIGGACYPEGHPESETLYSDIQNLKRKVDAGCDYLTTQMFFDNDLFYSFLAKCYSAGITVPIIPGIMPITRAAQARRTIALSGSPLPAKFRRVLDRFGDNPDAMRQAGVAYATEQIIDLYANGIKAVHVYSMNKPEVAAAIRANLSSII
ncbi:MAG TPA: methylenetetrahydrofolate reductase [NAD(P)H] [Candidatus Coproplasma excrementigallinarum]|uniref:Methylenetetrahydrofolate reductase n=1 Tax=Candidatus Coproplasma excrementigallinarum TaxID=2840747 RepID=A0A9D1MIX6_9FIRM|nr:methylenetetrahydrofolate reductase [NAD(P)H] [Candidatus Coproplasma excrementigallinarum]